MDMKLTRPLSSQQRRTLRCQFGSDAKFFEARCSVELPETVEDSALAAALRKLVERHEILRVEPDESFEPVGEAQNADGESAQATLRTIDIGMRARLRAQRNDTSEGPRLELSLPAVVADRLTLHHLVAELNALLHGDAVPLPESVPYALVVQWQQDLLHEPEAQVGIAFWKTRLANPPATPRLLLERADPSARFSPSRLSLPVGPEIAAASAALADRLGVSLQAVLVASWKTLIARMTGAPELVIGIVSPGRADESLQEVVGPLARTLPLRLAFHAEIPLHSAIEETDRYLFDAEAWQDCFSGGDDTAGPDDAQLPAFVFEMLDIGERPSASSLRIVDEYVCDQTFRLRLVWRKHAIDLDFDASRLSSAQAGRIAAAFLELLQHACAAPDTPGGAIAISSADQNGRLLQTVCFGPAAVMDAQAPVHESFVSMARQFPDRIAIAAVDGAISFAELERASRRVAQGLHRNGVGVDQTVAILADDAAHTIVAVLGILRAGAAFLPLDRLAPPQRLETVIASAEPTAFLVTTPASRRVLEPLAASASVALLTFDDALPADEPLPPIAVHPQQAAYVLYTSGSTGEPKGIVVPHGALANHMAWIIDALRIGSHDRILQRTPLSFDASIWEVFAPLITGGCLVQCATDANFDVDGLLQTIMRNEVTVMQTVPGLLQALLSAGFAGAGSVRTLCCGGDALPVRLWQEVSDVLGAEFVNLYGPTETCIDASWWRGDAPNGGSIPIGRPIAGGEMFVIESDMLAPIGVRGEIGIGGAGLARGYLGQPAATASVFVPYSWSPQPGARMYRTGDFAFWDEDGAAHFLGRQDDQIKLRGVRIQLEEIRSALLHHPAVRECQVMLSRDDGQSRQALLAFVELRADQDASHDFTAEWQLHLRSRLSDTMVPTSFVVLAQMPRTASGKPDRNALSQMQVTPRGSAPATATEQAVAVIWKELLDLEEIDTEQNFFALGGHSLLLTKLVARVAEELHVQVPLRGLFDAPTLSGFAAMIDALKAQPAAQPQVHDRPESEASRS
jgi:amino acid adenylation domain-containing protein